MATTATFLETNQFSQRLDCLLSNLVHIVEIQVVAAVVGVGGCGSYSGSVYGSGSVRGSGTGFSRSGRSHS